MAKHIKIGEPVNRAEEWAFNYLKEKLPDNSTFLTNLELYDEHGQPFEVDVVVISDYAIYLIDVKGYQGNLNVGKDIWEHDSRIVSNPLPKLNNNARILASRCRKRVQYNQHTPWCQSLIFITGGEGGEIQINKSDNNLPIYEKNEIIKALTQPDYVTSRFKNKLEQYQKKIALEALCDFKLLKQKEKIIGGYEKIRKIVDYERIETWLVKPLGLTFDYRYWMKYVDLTGCNSDELKYYRDRFKKEYYLLTELSAIPTIPAILHFIDEGENLALIHKEIIGKPLSKIKLDHNEIIDVLFNVAISIRAIHDKGVYHRALSKDNIFLSESGDITLNDIGVASTDKYQTIVSSKQLKNPWSAPEYINDNIYSDKSDVFTLACVFINYFSDTLMKSTNTVDFILEKFEFNGNDLCNSVEGLEEWFSLALSEYYDDRPTLSELLECFSDNDDQNSNTIVTLVDGEIINDKYKLISEIGSGATSTVWKAQHLVGNYECCLKIFEEMPEYDELAKSEFEILRTSYHPNIIRIFDLDYIPNTDRLFISCQLVNGLTLKETKINEFKIWDCFSQILGAIQYLHKINIIHKDIKPQNIVIEGDKAYLIDFNISASDSRLIGTVGYKDETVSVYGWTNLSDIYSLVITFVEKAWKHPFASNDRITNTDSEYSLPKSIKGISSKTRNRLQQIINRKVDWSEVTDYLGWFGLRDKVDIEIPQEIMSDWTIKDGYMVKVLRGLLSDMQPRSRKVIVKNTLKSNDIVGNKSNRGSANAAISKLKNNNIVEEYGTKIKLTDEFMSAWRYYSNC